MNNQLMSFDSTDLGSSITAMLYNGKPAFFAVQVAKSLGYERPQDALAQHCKSLIKLNFGEMQKLGLDPKPTGLMLLTEPDLYRLIMRSKLPTAERVQDWVCEEVLPSIRATGGYKQDRSQTPVVKEERSTLDIEALTTISRSVAEAAVTATMNAVMRVYGPQVVGHVPQEK